MPTFVKKQREQNPKKHTHRVSLQYERHKLSCNMYGATCTVTTSAKEDHYLQNRCFI